MDITTIEQIAPSGSRRERSVRPQTSFRLVSPVVGAHQGITLPVAGLTGLSVLAPWGADLVTPSNGTVSGARVDAMTHTSIDAFSFRRGRPPV